jgi:hypothetical protein
MAREYGLGEPVDHLAWEYLMAAQKAGVGLRDAVLTVLRLAQGGGRTATDTAGSAVRGLGRAVGSAGRSALDSLDHAVGSVRQGARSAGRSARRTAARGLQRAAHLVQPGRQVIQTSEYQPQGPGWLRRNARQARRRSAQKLRGFSKYVRPQQHRTEEPALYMASDPQDPRSLPPQFSLASDHLADDGLDYQI